mgnify:CR=1 FL=1
MRPEHRPTQTLQHPEHHRFRMPMSRVGAVRSKLGSTGRCSPALPHASQYGIARSITASKLDSNMLHKSRFGEASRADLLFGRL